MSTPGTDILAAAPPLADARGVPTPFARTPRSFPRRAVAFLLTHRPAHVPAWRRVCAGLLTSLILALPLTALQLRTAPAAAAPAAPAPATAAPAPTAAPVALAAPGQRWVSPVQPFHLIRGFRPPPRPWAAGHRGVDLALAEGGQVVSAGAGTVAFASQVGGLGVVVIRTGELRTTYVPVSAQVRVGQVVRAGDPIGTLAASTHCGQLACLHWGLLRGATYLDPLTLLARPRVRLLPLDGPVTVAPPAPAGSTRVLEDEVAPSARRSASRRTRTPGRPMPPIPLLMAASVAGVVILREDYLAARSSRGS